MVDFKNDLKETSLQLLDKYGVRYKEKDDLFHLLIKLYTFSNKYIAPQKRRVSYSAELRSKIANLPQATQEALAKLAEWSSEGVDINAFQSRGLYGDGSRDYQNALYGIVHLHLSACKSDKVPVLKKGRFAKPSDYLLFAVFRNDVAFFIDVVEHPQALSKKNPRVATWTSSELLKIIENNWPALLTTAHMPVTGLCDSHSNEINLSDEDIAELTVNGITTFIQGNNGFYMPQMGVTSSGDNSWAVSMAIKEINNASICQEHFLKHENEIRRIYVRRLLKDNIAMPQGFDFHYDYIAGLKKHSIVERNTGMAYDAFSGDTYTPKRPPSETQWPFVCQRLSMT